MPWEGTRVKTTITLQEDYLRYAEKMVEEGVSPSVSSVVEASLERMMHSNDAADPLAGMADEIRVGWNCRTISGCLETATVLPDA